MAPEEEMVAVEDRPRAAITGSAGADIVAGVVVVAALVQSSFAQRDLRVPPSSSALPHLFLLFRGCSPPLLLFELPLPLCLPSVNSKYSRRTSFHPFHFNKSCQKAGNVCPYLDLSVVIVELDASLVGLLYHAFMAGCSMRAVAMSSAASSAS